MKKNQTFKEQRLDEWGGEGMSVAKRPNSKYKHSGLWRFIETERRAAW